MTGWRNWGPRTRAARAGIHLRPLPPILQCLACASGFSSDWVSAILDPTDTFFGPRASSLPSTDVSGTAAHCVCVPLSHSVTLWGKRNASTDLNQLLVANGGRHSSHRCGIWARKRVESQASH